MLKCLMFKVLLLNRKLVLGGGMVQSDASGCYDRGAARRRHVRGEASAKQLST